MTDDISLQSMPGIAAMFAEREPDRYDMHSRHLNEQMVRVLRTIGYDVRFSRGTGQYLFDAEGARYLDLLSGFGVFGVGRNHPALRDALKNVLVEGARKGRAQEGACFRRAETIDGKVRQTVELAGDGSSAEQERDVFQPQSTSNNGECPRRLSIEPLSIVDDT